MKIGIDKIGFYAPHFFVDMEKLAEARGVDPAKYTIGIGQEKMAVAPITQDAVTLAANAACISLIKRIWRKSTWSFSNGIRHRQFEIRGCLRGDLLGIQEHARCIG